MGIFGFSKTNLNCDKSDQQINELKNQLEDLADTVFELSLTIRAIQEKITSINLNYELEKNKEKKVHIKEI